MKKLVTILMVCVILTLAGCGSSSTKQVTLEGKRFNTEKFPELSEEIQELIQGYMNSAVSLYQCTDISQPINAEFYVFPIEGESMSPNDYYNALMDTEEMSRYGDALYYNQEPDEHIKQVKEHLMIILNIYRAYDAIIDIFDEGGYEYNVSKSEWKAVEKALQEAIDYYYIDE